MERRKSELNPENYTRAIIALSRRHSSNSVFPGDNYIDLGEWMGQERYFLRSSKLKPDAKAEKPHTLAVVYNSGQNRWDVQQYDHEQHEDFCTVASVPTGDSGQIVFLRGFLSPSWVAAIGSRYGIDPEFFRRHMDFLSPSIDTHSYCFPSLASSSNNIFRVCVNTILHRDDFGGQDLQSQRQSQPNELATYRMQQLRPSRIRCGDSLVREYSTVCPRFSVIEQWISFCVIKGSKGWSVICWMDHGRPLEESPAGPWTRHIESQATALPVLQHHPKMAFLTAGNRLDPAVNTDLQVQQSTAMLPLQYDSLIALVDLSRRAPREPLSMCIPLFAHAAFAEVQFLNLMESRISIQTSALSQGVAADALETLQYFHNILNRHAKQLKDSMRAIHRLAGRRSQGIEDVKIKNHTPEANAARTFGSDKCDGPFTPQGVMEDHEQLHVRCVELSKMCTWGITLAMNKATIEESHKAIEQSERLKKLTLLATIFIPLTFSSSLLGMNVDLLGQNSVKFWWFFVLCVPTTLAAYIFYLWDAQAVRLFWVSFRKKCRTIKQERNPWRGEKDPSHLV